MPASISCLSSLILHREDLLSSSQNFLAPDRSHLLPNWTCGYCTEQNTAPTRPGDLGLLLLLVTVETVSSSVSVRIALHSHVSSADLAVTQVLVTSPGWHFTN